MICMVKFHAIEAIGIRIDEEVIYVKRKVVKVKVATPKNAKKVTICSQAVTND